MTTEILILIFIVLLLGYIVILHIQLAKKNIFIETTVKRLSGIEKKWNAEEMMKILREVREISHDSSFFTDKLFEDKPLGFLLENHKNSKIYIHYTKEKHDAENIIKEGFLFADSFYKTAIPVSDDRLDLLFKHNGRKSFGDYMIIICLSDRIFNHYSAELEEYGLKGFSVENVLTEASPVRNENADIIYCLSNRFIKGYINHLTGEIIINPDFNPLYDSPAFEKNLELLRDKPIN